MMSPIIGLSSVILKIIKHLIALVALTSTLGRGVKPNINDTNLQLLLEHAECILEPGIKEAYR